MSGRYSKRFVAYLMSFVMAVYPLYPYADEISDIGREGQSFGDELVNGFNNAASQINNGELTIPSMNNGVFDSANSTTVNLNDLFPGTNPNSQQGLNAFFPDGATPDVSVLQDAGSDAGEMNDVGRDFQSSLFNDANQDQPTTSTGGAYKVMLDSYNTSKPDMSNDPVFELTRNIYSNIDAISSEFGHCTSNTTFTNITNNERIPDYKTCERILDRSTNCTVIHDIDAEAPAVGFPQEDFVRWGQRDIEYAWSPQVGNRRTLTISLSANNRYSAGARYRFYVDNPDNISAFYVSGMVHFDEAGVAWHRSPSGINTVFAANNSYAWDTSNTAYYPNWGTMWGDYTPNPRELLPLLSRGWNEIGVGIMNSSRGGRLELNLVLESKAEVTNDSWTPASCIDSLDAVRDGFATGTVTCTQSYPTTNGCASINGMLVCQDQLQPSPLAGVGQFCQSAQVQVEYDFYRGTFCYPGPTGEQVCVESGNGSTNTCSEYESNPQCGYISQRCVDGAQAPDGTCYVMEEVWDCGVSVPVQDVESDTTYECAGPIRCMGADCMDPVKSQSTSFAQTAALLNAAQFMTQDMNCVDNGTGVADCRVFAGSPYECKIAVGGVQDCCDVPTNTSPGTYLQALFAMGKLDTSLMALDNGNVIKGAYQTLREPIADTVSTVTKPFTSYAENISGEVTEFFQPVNTYIDELKQKIIKAIEDTLNDMIGDTTANMGADAATSGAAQQATEEGTKTAGESIINNVGAAASTIMMAYTIYVVAVMVIQMVYECEPPEFELAAKKDTKSCHYVGSYCADEVLGACIEKRESYCCYNSPLSRIINEQIRPQLARPFGDPDSPDCEGITVGEVGSIDWSQVDLGEWTALLTQYNLMPDVTNVNMDSVTGSGNELNRIDGNRLNAADRTQQRIEGLDIDQARRDAMENTAVDPTGN